MAALYDWTWKDVHDILLSENIAGFKTVSAVYCHLGKTYITYMLI